jgi:hypothetical protein
MLLSKLVLQIVLLVLLGTMLVVFDCTVVVYWSCRASRSRALAIPSAVKIIAEG